MSNHFKHKRMTRNLGFTLVESLVAISILLVSVAAPLTLVIRSLQLSNYATTRMIAGFLAQDAFEYIRNIKDTNALATPANAWLTNIDAECFTIEGCAVDTTKVIASASSFLPCAAGTCPSLKRSISTYAYNLDPANSVNLATIFTRKVQIVDSVNSPGDDKFILVTISWSVGGFSKSITTQTSLRDWH